MVAIVSSAIASFLRHRARVRRWLFWWAGRRCAEPQLRRVPADPSFFLVLLIVALFGSGIEYTMVAIALTTWPRSARIMRAQVLSLKSRVYVQAARSAGASHLQRSCVTWCRTDSRPIVTDATILMGLAILTEAGLSFLGLGDQNAVSWGRMIFEGQRQLRLAPGCRSFPVWPCWCLWRRFNLLGDGTQPGSQPPAAPPCELVPAASRRSAMTATEAAPSRDAPTLEVRGLTMAYAMWMTRAFVRWTMCLSFCRVAAASV